MPLMCAWSLVTFNIHSHSLLHRYVIETSTYTTSRRARSFPRTFVPCLSEVNFVTEPLGCHIVLHHIPTDAFSRRPVRYTMTWRTTAWKKIIYFKELHSELDRDRKTRLDNITEWTIVNLERLLRATDNRNESISQSVVDLYSA